MQSNEKYQSIEPPLAKKVSSEQLAKALEEYKALKQKQVGQ
jgi:hypothetical protein